MNSVFYAEVRNFYFEHKANKADIKSCLPFPILRCQTIFIELNVFLSNPIIFPFLQPVFHCFFFRGISNTLVLVAKLAFLLVPALMSQGAALLTGKIVSEYLLNLV